MAGKQSGRSSKGSERMSHTDVQQEIAALRDEINRHNRLYYVEAAPTISESPRTPITFQEDAIGAKLHFRYFNGTNGVPTIGTAETISPGTVGTCRGPTLPVESL